MFTVSGMRSIQRTTRGDVRDALTISVAVAVVGVSFGALAPAAGLSPAMTMAMSLLVFAGGAQLLVTGVLAAGGGMWAAVAAGLVLNLRHLPFGLALARHLGGGWARLPAAHVVTDESTAFVLARTDVPGRGWGGQEGSVGRRCGSTTRWPSSSRVIGTVIRTQFASAATHAGSASGGAHDGPSSPDSSTAAVSAWRELSGVGQARAKVVTRTITSTNTTVSLGR